MSHYSNEREIEAVVRGFENCAIAKEAFTHQQHLTVAVWYLRQLNEEQALDTMRSGLLRFLGHHGIAQGKYKEALTVAWLKLIRATIDEMGPELTLLEVTNNVLDQLSHYSFINGASKPGD
jgi:hypothetical protein